MVFQGKIRQAVPANDQQLIAYYQNAFVLTKCKDIKIQEPKKKYIRRPMVQLDMTEKQFDKLVEKFK